MSQNTKSSSIKRSVGRFQQQLLSEFKPGGLTKYNYFEGKREFMLYLLTVCVTMYFSAPKANKMVWENE